MSKLIELDKLDRAIKDAEIRLHSIKASVEQIDKEIVVLAPRKIELEQNIRFLKKQDTVPIAQEFKKSKAELTKITSRLNIITSDREKASQAVKDVEEIIAKFKRDQVNLIISGENNILKGNFGSSRGKK